MPIVNQVIQFLRIFHNVVEFRHVSVGAPGAERKLNVFPGIGPDAAPVASVGKLFFVVVFVES